MQRVDFLIIGAGIVGLSLARALRAKHPSKKIIVLEKEYDTGLHASGRNSGVLHAGFYYFADSLKAKFAKDGCVQMKNFCQSEGLKINECGKLVVARNDEELEHLFELEKRGKKNNVEVSIIDEKQARDIDPNAKVFKHALYSPTTATVDPLAVSHAIKRNLLSSGVTVSLNESYKKRLNENTILTSCDNKITAGHIINAAGLYADKVAHDFGFGRDFVLVPFKGIYLKYTGKDRPVRTNIYPVPHRKNPFLGVHFTVTAHGDIKIGPTAIPAFWRENYKGFSNFSLIEFAQIMKYQAKFFITNAFGFRDLAFSEMKKYNRNHFVGLASSLIKQINAKGFNAWSAPGIRAQLINKRTLEIIMDFLVEGDKNSTHVLNAVSPAFTCSFPFAQWIIDHSQL